jgi:cullin-5
MKYALDKIIEEQKRAQRYLETSKDSQSEKKVMDELNKILISTYKTIILDECPKLISDNEVEKLHQMYKLMDRIEHGVDPMLGYLESHIVSTGLADMKAHAELITSDSEKYIEELLKLFNLFSTLVKNAFGDDTRFLTSRDKASHVTST